MKFMVQVLRVTNRWSDAWGIRVPPSSYRGVRAAQLDR
jgi:hypothetical protein